MVEFDVKKLEVNMSTSTAFCEKFSKQLKAKTEKLDNKWYVVWTCTIVD